VNKVLRDTWTKIAGSDEEQAWYQAGVRRDFMFLEWGHTVAAAAAPPMGCRHSSVNTASRLGLTVNCTILF